MRITRIYTEQPLTANAEIMLEAQASHHLVKVLRCKIDAPVVLFNGQGGQFHATITGIEKRCVQLQVTQFDNTHCESPLHIHLGIVVSRGERMDHVVQKATELGVCEITPLFSERAEVKLKAERLEKKQQHWQNVIIGACEQSGRNHLPKLHCAIRLNEWISSVSADQKFVLHHRTNQRLHNVAQQVTQAENVALLIGPEGGLSQQEITSAQNTQFNTLSLGPRVLRTETAPLVAITLLQHRWGDM